MCGRACKPDSVRRTALQQLRRDDHSSSPGLATGIQRPTRGFIPLRNIYHAEGSAFFRLRSASRAGSPLLFGLAPRGVCLAAAITGGAVGSYPTFSPLPACVPFVDIPEVFLRAITGSRSAGGLFSVALSVTRFFRAASPGVTRRVALALRPCGLRAFSVIHEVVSGLSSRYTKRWHLAQHVPCNQRSSSSPATSIIPRNPQ